MLESDLPLVATFLRHNHKSLDMIMHSESDGLLPSVLLLRLVVLNVVITSLIQMSNLDGTTGCREYS